MRRLFCVGAVAPRGGARRGGARCGGERSVGITATGTGRARRVGERRVGMTATGTGRARRGCERSVGMTATGTGRAPPLRWHRTMTPSVSARHVGAREGGLARPAYAPRPPHPPLASRTDARRGTRRTMGARVAPLRTRAEQTCERTPPKLGRLPQPYSKVRRGQPPDDSGRAAAGLPRASRSVQERSRPASERPRS